MGQALTAQAHRLVDRFVARRIAGQIGQCRIDQPGRQLGPLARQKLQVLAQRVGHDQDIGKQDRAVETEADDRLQGDLAGRLAIVGHRQESALFGAQFAIFGEIPASLAHEPERDRASGRTVECIEKGTGHSGVQ